MAQNNYFLFISVRYRTFSKHLQTFAQDHEGGADLQVLQQGIQQGLQGLANLQGLQNIAGATLQSLQVLAAAQGQVPGQNQEAGHYSDTTASAGGSDDEGSTAATDGSTLRTSPAEQVQVLTSFFLFYVLNFLFICIAIDDLLNFETWINCVDAKTFLGRKRRF